MPEEHAHTHPNRIKKQINKKTNTKNHWPLWRTVKNVDAVQTRLKKKNTNTCDKSKQTSVLIKKSQKKLSPSILLTATTVEVVMQLTETSFWSAVPHLQTFQKLWSNQLTYNRQRLRTANLQQPDQADSSTDDHSASLVITLQVRVDSSNTNSTENDEAFVTYTALQQKWKLTQMPSLIFCQKRHLNTLRMKNKKEYALNSPILHCSRGWSATAWVTCMQTNVDQ